MTECRPGWALVLRDLTPVDGDEADIVSVLKVYASETDALAEAKRLRAAREGDDCLYYIEATEVERP
jgi:hypothetical protein